MSADQRALWLALARSAADVVLSALIAAAFTGLAYRLCPPLAACCAAAGALLLSVVVSAAAHDVRSATALYRRAIRIH